MANIIINNIDIGCDDSDVLYEIIDKYTTGGDLDFNKIRPIPDELHIPEPFSSSLVKALSDYLSIINPHNKKYQDDPLRQKYPAVTCDEIQNILNKLRRYGDPGLITILQIDFPPTFVKTHFDHALSRDLMWIPLTIKTIEDWIDWLGIAGDECVYIHRFANLSHDAEMLYREMWGYCILNEDFDNELGFFKYDYNRDEWIKVGE